LLDVHPIDLFILLMVQFFNASATISDGAFPFKSDYE